MIWAAIRQLLGYLLVLSLTIGAAVSAPPKAKAQAVEPATTTARATPATTAAAPAAAPKPDQHVLGAGDVVRINVFQNPDLSLETRISEQGQITYPLVGTLSLGGLTLPAAEQRIAKALKDGKFVLNPQ